MGGGTIRAQIMAQIMEDNREVYERCETALRRVRRLERFISQEIGLVNDWAATKPCGTNMGNWILQCLDTYLKINP